MMDAPGWKVLVIGDVYWDTAIVPLAEERVDAEIRGADNDEKYARFLEKNGAYLLKTLIEKAAKLGKDDIQVVPSETFLDQPCCKDTGLRALAVLELFSQGIGRDEDKKIYRIKSDYGWVAPPDETLQEIKNRFEEEIGKFELQDSLERRIVVINDTRNIFRKLSASKQFIEKIGDAQNLWLVLSIGYPLFSLAEGKSEIWDAIKTQEELLERTVVVSSAASLRRHNFVIREQGAVEKIAYDLAAEMESREELRDLRKCRHIVVRFDNDSVFLFDKNRQEYFDVYGLPFEAGPRSNPARYGSMPGYHKILIASIVKEMLQARTEEPFGRIREGICLGLRLMAKHFRKGFAQHGFYADVQSEKPRPYEELFSPEIEESQPLAWLELPFSSDRLSNWNRVTAFQKQVGAESAFEERLVEIVQLGKDQAILNRKQSELNPLMICPCLKLGKLISIDPDEISGYYDIYRLVQTYLQASSRKTPLSIAVFGPPGSGKSRAVKEILKAASAFSAKLNGDALTYNLAEFREPANLTVAFHQAQDRALSKEEEAPLIFFDEFDADLGGQPYGWLKYFLAPMQDGKFKGAEEQGSYTVGKAIFVFAGATAYTFDEFMKKTASHQNAKAPDFISRLKGYLNIEGINTESKCNGKVGNLLALRRAIVLRSILEVKMKETIFEDNKKARIDCSIIRAFLRVPSYVHGVRSMEAIVEMARPDKGSLVVASLPSREQLRMHVKDVDQFLRLTKHKP